MTQPPAPRPQRVPGFVEIRPPSLVATVLTIVLASAVLAGVMYALMRGEQNRGSGRDVEPASVGTALAGSVVVVIIVVALIGGLHLWASRPLAIDFARGLVRVRSREVPFAAVADVSFNPVNAFHPKRRARNGDRPSAKALQGPGRGVPDYVCVHLKDGTSAARPFRAIPFRGMREEQARLLHDLAVAVNAPSMPALDAAFFRRFG
ncbi:MAG: hypothetical protein ACTH0C_03830 [Actinomycetaceae bacterium]